MNPIREFSLGDKQIWIQTFGRGNSLPIIYCLAGDELRSQLPVLEALITPALEKKLCRPFALSGYNPVDWNRDYTPWPAPELSPKSKAFAGGASIMLEWLQHTWLPEMPRRIPATPAEHYLLGYSLGGLCALWILSECSIFSGGACCSGSLWYDGWTDYRRAHSIARANSRVYLSLGQKEERARNLRMASVGDATRELHDQLLKDNNVAETILEWHEGGHFTDITGRLAKAVLWLMKSNR